MTLKEWAEGVTREFRIAGFTVEDYRGFPLVTRPVDMESTIRLLEFRSAWGVEKRIYAEGMLLVPAGSPRA